MLATNNFFQFFNSHKRLFTTILPNRTPLIRGLFAFRISLLEQNIFQFAIYKCHFDINHTKSRLSFTVCRPLYRILTYCIFFIFMDIYAAKGCFRAIPYPSHRLIYITLRARIGREGTLGPQQQFKAYIRCFRTIYPHFGKYKLYLHRKV